MALLNHLIGIGHLPEMVVGLTLGELDALPGDDDAHRLVRRYLERRAVVETGGPGGAGFRLMQMARA